MKRLPLAAAAAVALAVATALAPAPRVGATERHDWTEDELRVLRSLSIRRLGRPPFDPSHRTADRDEAAELGRRLFFDERLSRPAGVACATCHRPEMYFTDGLERSRGLGRTRRNAPTLVGAAYSPWQYWDGRRDSLWSQALVPLEHDREMGNRRIRILRWLARDPVYREAWREAFGVLPELGDRQRFPDLASPAGTPDERRRWEAMAPSDRATVDAAFAQVGKAFDAYQRRLVPGPGRFDRYVAALEEERDAAGLLTPREVAGLRLFIDPANQCLRCHNGPLFTNHGFHNTGVPRALAGESDAGRLAAIDELLADPFNCRGPRSEARAEQCLELNFMKTGGSDLLGAFKVPTLRGVTRTAPYFHNGALPDLPAVLRHYNRPVPGIGHLELEPLGLSEDDLGRIEAFLGALDSPLAEPRWARPPVAGR